MGKDWEAYNTERREKELVGQGKEERERKLGEG